MKRLVVKTGSYTDREGNQKNNYERLGVLMENSNGMYLLLKPSMSLAGLHMLQNPNGDRDRLMVSVFEDDNQRGQQRQRQPQGGAPAGGAELDDEIPFKPVGWV